MTIWTPDLSKRTGPKYQAIASALADDIAAGVLSTESTLPTHRDLAWRLGVTVGTVSRAYALAQSWGLIAGEVGRGTRVLPATRAPDTRDSALLQDAPVAPLFPPARSTTIEMSRNYPVDAKTDDVLATALRKLASPVVLGQLGGYQPPTGSALQRQAGAAWLGYNGIDVTTDRVVLTNGCQHALWIAFSTLASRGDTVVTEALTWPGARNLAELLGLQVRAAPMDDDGMHPDALDDICRSEQPRFIYMIPTQQNPTATVMSEARRHDIIEVARRHSAVIVEDGVFGFLPSDAPPPIAALAPDITVHATSISKAVSPALRTGFLTGPASMIPRFATLIQTTTIMPPTLAAQLSADLILSGAAATAADRQRSIAANRVGLATRLLGNLGDRARPTHANASQIWLPLPEHWDSRSFANEAMARGVAVTPGDAFCASPESADPRAVRLCLCAEGSDGGIETGLGVVAALIASHPAASAPIV